MRMKIFIFIYLFVYFISDSTNFGLPQYFNIFLDNRGSQ